MQFLQAVSAIEGRVKKDKFSEFVLYALQGMDHRGGCTIEKGIAIPKSSQPEQAPAVQNSQIESETDGNDVVVQIQLTKLDFHLFLNLKPALNSRATASKA